MLLAALGATLSVGRGLVSCTGADGRSMAARLADDRVASERHEVRALGNLRVGRPPTEAEVNLANFLFGTDPPSTTALVSPATLAAGPLGVAVCDTVLDGVVWWSFARETVTPVSWTSTLDEPLAIDIAPDGNWLLCDRGAAFRTSPTGSRLTNYRPDDTPFKPTGILAVGDAVWVANAAAHRIEVFAAESGAWQRSIGQPGRGPLGFALPRAMTRTPDGNVCIVDMLNNRVQVISPTGAWIRDIGRPGDAVGAFGRPKAIAVGPDGTAFVTDAFSQQVHAFNRDGQPLLAFGGQAAGRWSLALPHGIAVTTARPPTATALPDDREPDYYVLVSEQLHRPGVRVFAWFGHEAAELTWRDQPPPLVQPTAFESSAPNPHWKADACDTCHAITADGAVQPIPPAEIDAGCLACHDGVRAPSDPHPIGRPAVTPVAATPSDWPTPGGELSCITCHAIQRHCDPAAERPRANPILLRGYNVATRQDWCATCHLEPADAFNPHLQPTAAAANDQANCLFCHEAPPPIADNGRRTFAAKLHRQDSRICLSCHVPHWDFSPRGHLGRVVTEEMRQWMVAQERRLGYVTPAPPKSPAAASPALLPLGQNKADQPVVTCYSCHNPHPRGLFPARSVLAAWADEAEGAAVALRLDWMELCLGCHQQSGGG